MRLAVLGLVASAVLLSLNPAMAPVFVITPEESSIKFSIKASVPLEGTFDKWDATIRFTSPDVSTGVLDVKIQAATVNTGSGLKDGKLKSKDFFDAEHDPLITFLSNKILQTGPNTFDARGTFTIHGVSKPEKLTFTVSVEGTRSGEIKGTMAFDRKEFGMNSEIPFIKVADSVGVAIDLKMKRVSGPPLVFKKYPAAAHLKNPSYR